MIRNIQLLRFLFATGIALFHLNHYYFKDGGNQEWLISILQYGICSIHMFFVISGYIIWHTTKSYQGLEKSISFITKRFTRIFSIYWPIFFVCLTIIFVRNPNVLKKVDFIASFFLLTSASPGQRLLIEVTWTLTFELYFYLIFSLFILLGRRYIKSVLLAWAFFIAVSNIFLINVFNLELISIFINPMWLDFIIGCLLREYMKKPVSTKAICFNIVFAITGFILSAYYNLLTINGFLQVVIVGLCSAMLLIAFISLEWKGLFRASNLTVALGNASFAFFLTHPIILLIYQFWLKRFFDPGENLLPKYFLILILMIAYSLLHHKYIEKLPVKYGKQLWHIFTAR